ncbi:MAG: hypothetical protein ABIS08_11455 [Pseudolysinimonas sp.]
MSQRIALIAALLLVLSGCTATPGAVSSHGPSRSATPTASPAPTTRPALSELVVTPSGIGDIRLGKPVPADAPAVSVVTWDEKACVSDGGLSVGEPYSGLWTAAYPPVDGTGESVFALVTDDGTKDAVVSYVAIRVPSAIRSDAGIHVGDTLDALKAAYPGGFFQSAKGQNGADVYVAGDADGVIAYDVSAPYPSDPNGWTADQLHRVIAMNVFVPRSDPILPNYGTTNSGLCPD